jgi:hypothetical protein
MASWAITNNPVCKKVLNNIAAIIAIGEISKGFNWRNVKYVSSQRLPIQKIFIEPMAVCRQSFDLGRSVATEISTTLGLKDTNFCQSPLE